MVKKRMGLYSPVERKTKPKRSIKSGETKHLIFYSRGNRSYFVFKKLKKLTKRQAIKSLKRQFK